MFLLLGYFFFFYGVLLFLGFILFSISAGKITLLLKPLNQLFDFWNHYFPKRLFHHQRTQHELFKIKFKAFNTGAYKIARRFWKDYFAKGPYLASVGEKPTSVTNLWLPEDVLLEILARLPVKSLLRFRSVCRSWRDIMKEPTFITKHHLSQVAFNNGNCLFSKFLFNPTDDYGLLEKDDGGIKCTTLELPFLENSPKAYLDLEVAGPCNGIVVISDGRDMLFLWNPATREYKALPPSSLPSSLSDNNRTDWWSCVGFGIDPVTKDYKVVRVWHFDCTENWDFIGKVEVMSLSATNLCRPKSETWKIIPAAPPATMLSSADHLYANGKHYWLASIDHGLECRLVWFDMGREVFGKIELPNNFWCVPGSEKLVVLKGCVMMMRHAYIVEEEENKLMYELSIIDDDGRLTKYATVGPFMPSERPMAVWKNQELITSVLNAAAGYDFIFYDININVIKSQKEGGLIKSDCVRGTSFHPFDIYNESLISFGG